MRIGFKLVLGFVILSVIAAALGFWNDRTNRAVKAEVDSLAYNSIVDFADATEMQLALMACHVSASQMLESRRGTIPPSQEAHTANIRQNLRDFQRSFARAQAKRVAAQMKSPQLDEQQRRNRNTVDPLLKAYREHSQMLERFLDAADGNSEHATAILYGELTPHLRREVLPLLEEFKQTAEHQFTAGVRNVEETLAVATQHGHLATTVSLTSSIALGLVFSRLIGRPLTRLTATARDLGTGNLSARSDVRLNDELGVLADAINQMATQLQSTMVLKAEVDNILESMREMLLVTDPKGNVIKANRAVLEVLGYSAEAIIGQSLTTVFADLDRVDEVVPQCNGEHLFVASSDKRFPVHCSGAVLKGGNGRPAGYVLVALDISEHKRAEAALQASVSEKEILLRELHHRVKNNLQIISSLLQLQGRQTKDPQASRFLKESEARVRSMSLIHEQLYTAPDFSDVDFREYLIRLAEQLAVNADDVQISVEAGPIRLPVSQAIPCGMIINELVSNSIEHAFPGVSGGKITITATIESAQCVVSVIDDGIGMTSAALQAHPSLGLQIVQALATQLQAKITVDDRQGTSICVSFEVDQRICESQAQKAHTRATALSA